eukprot:3684348-Rhodomonas_salina.1
MPCTLVSSLACAHTRTERESDVAVGADELEEHRKGRDPLLLPHTHIHGRQEQGEEGERDRNRQRHKHRQRQRQ